MHLQELVSHNKDCSLFTFEQLLNEYIVAMKKRERNPFFTNPSGIIEESPQAEMLKVVEGGDKPEAEPSRATTAED